jgi:hypothetical protein
VGVARSSRAVSLQMPQLPTISLLDILPNARQTFGQLSHHDLIETETGQS